MPNYVTKEHFDVSIAGLDKKFVTKEYFDASIAVLDKKFVTNEHFDASMAELDQRFVTKGEFGDFRSENTSRLDEIITILLRLDQERFSTIEWIRRIESDVSIVKKHLKLA